MRHETRCIHTFEINYRRCKICGGQNRECRCYEPCGGHAAARAAPAPESAGQEGKPLWGQYID